MSGYIRHTHSDNERHDAAEGPCDGIPYDWSSGAVGPLRLPDHGAAGDDGQTADNEHDKSDVLELGSEEPGEEDHHETKGSEWELPQDGVQRCPSEGRDNERTKARDGSVDGIAAAVSMR